MSKKLKPIYKEIWRNGAAIEVYFHEYPADGYDPSDRIELVVTACDGVKPSMLINVEDAIGIIHGLAMGIQRVVDRDIPTSPKQTRKPKKTKWLDR